MPNHAIPARDSLAALDLARRAYDTAAAQATDDPRIRAGEGVPIAALIALCVCPVSPRKFAGHIGEEFELVDLWIRKAFDLIRNPAIGPAFHAIRHRVSRGLNCDRYLTH